MTKEIWKTIPEYPFHEASNLGRIRSIPRTLYRTYKDGSIRTRPIRQRELKQFPHQAKKSRKPTALTLRMKHESGKCKTVYAHHIILFAFVGAKPDGLVCCHYDGNALNNELSNLRWDTPESNVADAVRHGTHYRPNLCGDSCHTSKLTNEQIIRIMNTPWGKRGTGSALAKEFGVGNSAIYEVRSRYRKRPDLYKRIQESVKCLTAQVM